MKLRPWAIIALCGMFLVGCAGASPDRQWYTAYNIWIYPYSGLWCINFKNGGTLLPAGTPVKNIAHSDEEIAFETLEGTEYRVRFTRRWHPGKSARDYRGMMFTPHTFYELTQGLSENEIAAIQKGVLVPGMSKKAVIIAYGPPAEHTTPSLEANLWVYWMDRQTRKVICFDANGYTGQCGAPDVKFEDTL